MRLHLTHHTYANLARIAEQFLVKHNPKGRIPVPIEEIVEFDWGIHVVPMPGMHEIYGIDGFTSHDLTQIFIDETVLNKRLNRFRFTLAHEMSHAVLHAAVYKELAFSSIESWKKAVKGIEEDDYAWLEYQADALAGLILVPGAELKKAAAQALREVQKIGLDLDNRSSNDVAKGYVANNLGRKFEVSPTVIQIRLDKDGLWPPPKL